MLQPGRTPSSVFQPSVVTLPSDASVEYMLSCVLDKSKMTAFFLTTEQTKSACMYIHEFMCVCISLIAILSLRVLQVVLLIGHSEVSRGVGASSVPKTGGGSKV